MPTADEVRNPLFAVHVDEDEIALAAERRTAVRHALTALPDRQRTLLRLLHSEREPSYEAIGAAARHAGRQHRADARARAGPFAQRNPPRTRSRLGLPT